MYYLDETTIQIFTHFLYNKDDVFGASPLNLIDFEIDDRWSLIND